MSTPKLPTLKALLADYRASHLKTMLSHQGWDSDSLKADNHFRLSRAFATREHVRKSVAALDPVARALLERVQIAQGTLNWIEGNSVLVSEGLVSEARKVKRSYNYYEEFEAANVKDPSSRALQDVLARLELHGLLLGSQPHGYNNVVDFGNAQHYHIPQEVWAHLPPVTQPPLEPATVAQAVPGDAQRFSRELYVLWSFIWQAQPKLLSTTGLLAKRDLTALAEAMPRPIDVKAVKREDELPLLHFQRRLLEALGLARAYSGQLRGDAEKGRQQWAKPLAERAADWLQAWSEGRLWNELLRLDATDWKTRGQERHHAPAALVQGRRHLLQQIQAAAREGLPDGWINVAALAQRIQQSERSFLLPYMPSAQSYGYNPHPPHRYRAASNPHEWDFSRVTSEVEGWTKVERALLWLVAEVLHWMGLADLGQNQKGQTTALRLTALGRHLLLGEAAPAEAPTEGARVVVQPNFHIVAFGPVGEATLMELERFATRLSADRAVEYELTRDSVYRAQQAGWDGAKVQARLEALTGTVLPQNVARTLAEWQASHERIRIHQHATLLQSEDAALMDELAATAGTALRRLAPTIALMVQPKQASAALARLELSPVTRHDPTARATLYTTEDGRIAPRTRAPDLYLQGRLALLAEPDAEAAGFWRVSRASVRRARREGGLDATAQLAAWATLLGHAPPPWLESDVKRWSGFFGKARRHTVTLLELRDDKVLKELRADPRLAALLTPFKPKGPLVSIEPNQADSLRAILDEYGVEWD